MKNIYLIRHGETDNNKFKIIQGRGLDASLNERGRAQARAICRHLRETPVDRIVCSSLIRTRETARPLEEALKLESVGYDALDEIDFGILEGQKFTDIQDQIQVVQQEWSSGNTAYAPENGESPEEAFRRANTKIMELLEEDHRQVAVFVHGRLIRILLSVWLDIGLRNMHQIEHTNGAINHLQYSKGKFRPVELNLTAHLPVSG